MSGGGPVSSAGQAGQAVDAAGKPAFDPSKNVLDLVEAAVLRLDDLRAAETRRQDDMRAQSEKHTAEMARLNSDYQEKLRDAEAKRIDAIRAVDVNAVAVASGRAADQATVLANQVQVSADALRSLVATTQSALAAQHAASTAEITKRLTELERAKYEGAGRSTVADPMLTELVAEMKSLRESRASITGNTAGKSATWAAVATLVGLLLALATFFGLKSQPEVRYVPSPAAQSAPASPR